MVEAVRHRSHSNAGFSLLELLVALTILSLSLATAYRIVGGAVATTSSRERLVRLTTLAEAAMNDLRLTGQTSAHALTFDWPDDIAIDIEEENADDLEVTQPTPLRRIRLKLRDEDNTNLEIAGIIRLHLPPGDKQ
ncbi:MAG: type II secretion system protein [Geminicoccaceae bacterium]|nr:type II secretion system protein [Geminicoccaceae bacterium]